MENVAYAVMEDLASQRIELTTPAVGLRHDSNSATDRHLSSIFKCGDKVLQNRILPRGAAEKRKGGGEPDRVTITE